jgi:hypothetical protein
MGRPGRNAVRAGGRRSLAAPQSLIDRVDQAIAYFNSRRMDLPDGLFDRTTQFLINGATFESFLSTTPNDPLIMMLARGPAGYRFTAKALQHAIPDAKLERGDLVTDGDPAKVTLQLWLSGKLRGPNEPVNALVNVSLRLTQGGSIESAAAVIDPVALGKIQDARRRV